VEWIEIYAASFHSPVTGQAVEKLRVAGIAEAWLQSEQGSTGTIIYRPAVLIDYTVNFRSLRAGFNHSEERSSTAWLPEGDLALDWDSRGGALPPGTQLSAQPEPGIGYRPGDYRANKTDFEQYAIELIEKLARTERLKIYFNPVFGFFSAPGDPLEDFLARVADAALGRIEPELKRLRIRFELQLEQVREAQVAKGLLNRRDAEYPENETMKLESLISNKLQFFESENRLAGMFSTLAGAVFGSADAWPKQTEEPEESELREDLERIEQEASEALRALYDEYLALASEYDHFEIGVQPDNIQVIRSMLLWVPVEEEQEQS
jgi:hypothetical protein